MIAGKTCAGKGIFITLGADITISGITFADASVIWHNGAGIRAAGDNLTVEHSRFLHNENGILAGGGPDSVLRITDSEFIGNGACIALCAHGVYAGAPIALLDIEHSVFRDTKVGHHIKSRARNTIVRDSRIEDGPDGTASYLIDIPNGGNVLIQGNTMEKGAHSENPATAIAIGEEGVKNPTTALIVRDNVFHGDGPVRTAFVRNTTVHPGRTGRQHHHRRRPSRWRDSPCLRSNPRPLSQAPTVAAPLPHPTVIARSVATRQSPARCPASGIAASLRSSQ